MAKKTTKAVEIPQSKVVSDVSTPPQQGAEASSIGKAFGEVAKVQAQRAGLAALLASVEKQKARLREAEAEYQDAVAKVDQLKAEVIAKYPEAEVLLGDSKKSKLGGAKRGPKPAASKKGAPVLDKAQAEQVLAALPSAFKLSDFKMSSKGAMNLLADQAKDTGGKGMGRKYKKV
jgi:hypothetical protein